MSIKVGSGESTLFWKVLCYGEKYLQESFPRLYSISNKRSAKVGEVVGGVNMWNLTFKRKLFVREENLILELK